jgi:hypothetical protein
MERDKKAQKISDIWHGNNLSMEGLKQTLKNLGTKFDKKSIKIPPEGVKSEWNRLAKWAKTGQQL